MKRKALFFFISATLTFLFLTACALHSLHTALQDQLLYAAYGNKKSAFYPLFHKADAKTMKEVNQAFDKAGYGGSGRRYLRMQFYEEPSFLMLVMLIPGYALVCFCLFKYLHKQQCTQIQSIAQAFQQPSVHTTDPMYQPIIQAHHHSLKQTEHELADVKKELQNQREHYENLAHQIKAVLTTTMLHADMLMEETNEQHHLPAILVQMEKANDLLDVYLQGKDVKSNLFPYHYTYAPLQLALEHAIARTQAYAKTKDIQFSLTADASIVFAYDSFWMEEAIETILRNGITYANASSCIEVVLSASDGHIVLDLRDTGMCMRKDDIQKAFVRYAHSDHKEHYGIGLAMAKQIIEQHFGTITILPFAHGVTFHIVFPQMDLEETA